MPNAREKKAAHDFAARARAGHTYYIVETIREPSSQMRGRTDKVERLKEIVFHPPTRSSRLLSGTNYPRWFGPHTAFDCYLKQGPIYEDRNDPKIAHLMTYAEHDAYLLRLEHETVTSEQWVKELRNATSGTRFNVRR